MNPQIQKLLHTQFQDLILSDLQHNTFAEKSPISLNTMLEMVNFIDATIAVEVPLEQIFDLADNGLTNEDFSENYTHLWLQLNEELRDGGLSGFNPEPVSREHTPAGKLDLAGGEFKVLPDGVTAFFLLRNPTTNDHYKFTHRTFQMYEGSQFGQMTKYVGTTNPMINLFIQYYFWKSLAVSCHPNFSEKGKDHYRNLKQMLILQHLL
jgi:hypothetical protein